MQAAEVRSQQLVKKRRVIQMVYCSSSLEGDGGREKMELGANEIATSSAQKPVVDLISFCRVGFGRNEAEFQGQGRQRVPFLSIKVL